jgi:hypothetical protein
MTRTHFRILTAAIAVTIGLGIAVVVGLSPDFSLSSTTFNLPVVVDSADLAAAPERFTYQDITTRLRCSRGPRDARDDA